MTAGPPPEGALDLHAQFSDNRGRRRARAVRWAGSGGPDEPYLTPFTSGATGELHSQDTLRYFSELRLQLRDPPLP